MGSRFFESGIRKQGMIGWIGRCEVLPYSASITPFGEYLHHAQWPQRETERRPFYTQDNLEKLILAGKWVEVMELDPDLQLAEGM